MTAIKSKNIGRIRIQHNPNKVSIFKLRYLYNLSIITIVVGSIILVSNSFAQQTVLGREYEAVEILQAGINFASRDAKYLMTNQKKFILGDKVYIYDLPNDKFIAMIDSSISRLWKLEK